MEAEIGNASGTIWHYLNQHGEMTLSKLERGTKLPDQLLLMGLGWLAREGKLNFVQAGRNVHGVSLKGSQVSLEPDLPRPVG